ncbi:unnamed protein product [Trichogramma brassicae]|uniref:Uncharacterized protein n=1 Tax=Trichogramma brassicae TaxID=86971 RepID=A0A6H5IBE8_9HYME|nr:unnamed protein product [Trichogramma brassicae]
MWRKLHTNGLHTRTKVPPATGQTTDRSASTRAGYVDTNLKKNVSIVLINIELSGRVHQLHLHEAIRKVGSSIRDSLIYTEQLSRSLVGFLDSGRDPNYPVRWTGDTPLISALEEHKMEVVELLLRRDADPNLANAKGFTPLHVLCKHGRWLEEFFKIVDDIGLTVQVDPRDKLGRTPLQCAVACLCTHTVDVLLDRGADLSKFVFPTAAYLGKRKYRPYAGDKFNEAFSIPIIVASLEKRGYEFSRSDALTIMKYFARRKLFAMPTDVVHPWYKNATIRENLSLCDLIQLRSKEALQLVTFEDFVSLRRWSGYWSISLGDRETCAANLCENLSRGFLRRWALEPFMELIHYRLPILCCEMIIDDLSNEDLLNICQAAAAAMRTKRKPNGKKCSDEFNDYC